MNHPIAQSNLGFGPPNQPDPAEHASLSTITQIYLLGFITVFLCTNTIIQVDGSSEYVWNGQYIPSQTNKVNYNDPQIL